MKKATLQTVARDVRAIARSLAVAQPGKKPALGVVPPLPYAIDGEIEVGLTLYGNEPRRLILITKLLDGIARASWSEVQAFAKKNNASTPSRIDALMLWYRAPKHFKTDLPYWTSEEFAGDSVYAWRQWFDDGDQSCWFKDNKCRACLVRRLPI